MRLAVAAAALLAGFCLLGVVRAGHVGTNYGQWTDGMMYYTLNADIEGRRDDIETAISWIHENTNCRLKERTTESAFVEFKTSTGCSSYLGFVNFASGQPINLAPGCGVGSITHEIMHAYGVHHEMTRADRDTYVTIVFDDIQPARHHNFNIPTNHEDVGPYAYNSLMHYPKVAFPVVSGTPTVIPKPDPNTPIGNRAAITASDIASLNYFCPSPSCSSGCVNGQCRWGTTTSQAVCVCDDFSSGATCDQLVVAPKQESAQPANGLTAYSLTPAASSVVDFTLTVSSGEADLYVAYGRDPTSADYDLSSTTSGNDALSVPASEGSDVRVAVHNPGPGTASWSLGAEQKAADGDGSGNGDGTPLTPGAIAGIAVTLAVIGAMLAFVLIRHRRHSSSASPVMSSSSKSSKMGKARSRAHEVDAEAQHQVYPATPPPVPPRPAAGKGKQRGRGSGRKHGRGAGRTAATPASTSARGRGRGRGAARGRGRGRR